MLHCPDVNLRDVRIHDEPRWTIHLVGHDDLSVDGLHTDDDLLVPNCDGIGIGHCKSVEVFNCWFIGGNDCIIVRASRMFDSYRDGHKLQWHFEFHRN